MCRPRATLALLALLLVGPLAASAQTAQAAPNQQQPLSWIPQGFEVLGQRAAFHTDFTFDRSMLHPRLQQPMRLVDHLCFVAEHDDHHLARIWELLQTR